MVWQQALYLVNLLCKFVPCDYNFPPPDTSLSEGQAFKDLITLGVDKDNPGSLRIGGGSGSGGEGWGVVDNPNHEEIDYTENDPLVVITKTGKLRGYWMRVVGGRKIRAYEGIPYAEPPTGYFRFSEPSPKIPWSGLLWANKKGPKCLQFSQIELKRIVGSEDCLCLNIYAPKAQNVQLPSSSSSKRREKDKVEKFPVLIFIHGGGFQIGGGNDYGPSYLLQQDLILVTFNYRVGVFGFLSTGDKASPGNYGLKDQSLAIQWVYENIDVFHGDPSRITLVGQEAGGASVHLQMLSGRARPFFQAGISMSGTAFNSWVFCSKAEAHTLAKYYAKKFSCPVHTSEAIVSCLRRADAAALAKTQIQFLDDLPIPIYLFRPVLEDMDQKEIPFLTQTPEELYRQNLVARVPYIAGFTEDEGLTFLLPSVFRGSIKHLRSNWNHLAPDFLDYQNIKGVDVDDVTKKINWLYFKQKTPLTATIKTFSDAISLRFTVTGVHKALQAHSTLAPTYGYMFSYNGKYNLATLAGIKPHEWGVGQGEDLFYLLNSTHLYQGFLKSDHEMILAKIMVNLFGNFASKRYPTFTMENREDFAIWSPITDPRNMSFLLIHKKIKMIPEPYLKQSVYWESIGIPDTTPYINTTEHYKDYHFITATPPPPHSRVLSSQQFPQPNSFHSVSNYGSRDIFNLRANLSLRQAKNTNIKIRPTEEVKEIQLKVEEQPDIKDVGVEDLDGNLRQKHENSIVQNADEVDDQDFFKSYPITETSSASPITTSTSESPPSSTTTPIPYDENQLFLPPWNPYGMVNVVGVSSTTELPEEEDVSPTIPTLINDDIITTTQSSTSASPPIEDEEEKSPFQFTVFKNSDISTTMDPNLLKDDEAINGHQYPLTTTPTPLPEPNLPNSLDLLDDIALSVVDHTTTTEFPSLNLTTHDVYDVSLPGMEQLPIQEITDSINSTTPTPTESEMGPDGVEEAEVEKFSLGFKQDPFPSAYEDDTSENVSVEDKDTPTEDKSTSTTTTATPTSSTLSTTSTSIPRVIYRSRYHSPYVSNEISDHKPYNIMK